MNQKEAILQQLNHLGRPSLMETLGIVFTDFGEDFLIASMPVTPLLHQPMGLLHGGASIALAESVGSCLSNMVIDRELYHAVGTQINSNHLKSVKEGIITATAKMIKKGKSIHVLEIKITNENGDLVCFTTMSNMILSKQH